MFASNDAQYIWVHCSVAVFIAFSLPGPETYIDNNKENRMYGSGL